MVTLKADNRRRIQIVDAKPGQVFVYENQGGGRILLTLVVEPKIPLVKARKVNGRWMGAESVKFDRTAVVASIQEDRERR